MNLGHMQMLKRFALGLVLGGYLLFRLPIPLLVNLGNLSIVRYILHPDDAVKVSSPLFEVMYLFPKNAQLDRIHGIHLFLKDEFESATQYLRDADELCPNDMVTIFWLGKAYEASAHYVEALVMMHRTGMDDYFPPLPEQMSETDMLHFARDVLRNSVGARAKVEAAKRVYVIDRQLAQALFESAFVSEPDNLESSLNVAWFCFNNRDYDCAEQFAERAVQQFPSNPLVYLFLGTFHRQLGDTDLAIRDLYRVVDLSSNHEVLGKAYLELSKVYLDLEQYPSALDCLALAEQIGGSTFPVHLLGARIYSELHHCDLAQKRLGLARDLTETQSQQDLLAPLERIVQKECANFDN